MKDNNRFLLAIGLSLLFIFGWQKFYVEPKMLKAKALQEATTKTQTKNSNTQIADTAVLESEIPDAISDNANSDDSSPTDIAASEIPAAKAKTLPRGKALKTSKRVKIKTPNLHGSVNLQGALLDDITLANYHETLDKTSPEVVLLSPKNTKGQYFISAGYLSKNDITLPNDNTKWKKISGDVLDVKAPITLSYTSPEGVEIQRTISIDSTYLITVSDKIINNSKADISLSPFSLINRHREPQTQVYISHEGLIAAVDGILEESTYDDIADEDSQKQVFKNVSGWAGIVDKYWMTSIIPDNQKEKNTIRFSHYMAGKQHRYQTDILETPVEVSKGGEQTHKYSFYVGVKKLALIDKYAEEKKLPVFDRNIDFGVFYFLTKPMLKLLTYFYDLIGNFGLSIMALTVVVRLILYPLANTSYKSMAKMRKHMPEMTKMKEKYKDDRQKLGQEMMKYYKSHGINPASGCLPMIVQIPVFFSLYKVLYNTIEMRHAPFFGWIKDLSEKDTTTIYNLFGLFDYNVPAWLPQIGILPLLFAITMVIQQKLNPPPQDETQRIVMAWMPWILLFVFVNFPAGLIVYWIWNNILSILQQWHITKRIEASKND